MLPINQTWAILSWKHDYLEFVLMSASLAKCQVGWLSTEWAGHLLSAACNYCSRVLFQELWWLYSISAHASLKLWRVQSSYLDTDTVAVMESQKTVTDSAYERKWVKEQTDKAFDGLDYSSWKLLCCEMNLKSRCHGRTYAHCCFLESNHLKLVILNSLFNVLMLMQVILDQRKVFFSVFRK